MSGEHIDVPVPESRCYLDNCNNPAVCFGEYEANDGHVLRVCDVHCGHGNEDGWCAPIDDLWKVYRLTAEEHAAAHRKLDALRDAIPFDEVLPLLRELRSHSDGAYRRVFIEIREAYDAFMAKRTPEQRDEVER